MFLQFLHIEGCGFKGKNISYEKQTYISNIVDILLTNTFIK